MNVTYCTVLLQDKAIGQRFSIFTPSHSLIHMKTKLFIGFKVSSFLNYFYHFVSYRTLNSLIISTNFYNHLFFSSFYFLCFHMLHSIHPCFVFSPSDCFPINICEFCAREFIFTKFKGKTSVYNSEAILLVYGRK